MSDSIIQEIALGPGPWPTADPFLFCVHHLDAYPAGDERMAPIGSLVGRDMGQDFANIDGWNMYHGQVVPGFPQHPHRGFETITHVRRGLIDHADSLGATARFGAGDTQWMTAGRGITHCEMFPLVNTDEPNPLELFQIWLNLPSADKMVDPYFTMLWDQTIPKVDHMDDAGRSTTLTVVAGSIGGATPPAAPPDSWASRSEADLAIWHLAMEPGAAWTLPAALGGAETGRTLYLFEGESLDIAGATLGNYRAGVVPADRDLELTAGPDGVACLMLQGRPIGEPVEQYGPFVMNTSDEIRQAFADYQAGTFGQWPWGRDDPNHERDRERFAIHADGRVDTPV